MRAEQQVTAYNLRLTGLSLRAIGEQMGVSHTTVSDWVKAECRERVLPLADEVRQMEIDRYDAWLVKLNEQIDEGNQVARNVEVAVKVSERRARLLGVDAPLQQEIAGTLEHRPTELLDRLALARAKVALEEAELRSQPPSTETGA
jgi:transcriptional regulator with XRE-family HTH domain